MRPARPVVGVTPDFLRARAWTKYTVYDRYVEALRAAGALPVLLAPDVADVEDQLRLVGGVLLPGGDDLDPALWGETPAASHVASDGRRTSYELALARRCLTDDVPFLGICLGMQLLNVACGGTLVQELPPGPVRHHDPALDLALRHDVVLEPDTVLARAVGRPAGGRLSVNSFHRQAPRVLGRHLVACARADDAVIEAIEHADRRFCVGVQWHPDVDAAEDEAARALLGAFVGACALTAR